MKVILLKELKGKGGEGDVIEVANGFANNYLLTQGYAIRATKGNLKQLEQRRHNIAKREEVRIAKAEQLKADLDGKVVPVLAQVGEEGQLFGSVTAPMIADALKEEFDIDIDRRRIELGNPIKVAGEHQVTISIYREIRATVTVLVHGGDITVGDEIEEADAETADEATAMAADAVEAMEAIDGAIADAEIPTDEVIEVVETED